MSNFKKNLYLLFAIVFILCSCNSSFADENKHDFNKNFSTDSTSCQKPIIEYFPNGEIKIIRFSRSL